MRALNLSSCVFVDIATRENRIDYDLLGIAFDAEQDSQSAHADLSFRTSVYEVVRRAGGISQSRP